MRQHDPLALESVTHARDVVGSLRRLVVLESARIGVDRLLQALGAALPLAERANVAVLMTDPFSTEFCRSIVPVRMGNASHGERVLRSIRRRCTVGRNAMRRSSKSALGLVPQPAVVLLAGRRSLSQPHARQCNRVTN
jgi:hypothetical protein